MNREERLKNKAVLHDGAYSATEYIKENYTYGDTILHKILRDLCPIQPPEWIHPAPEFIAEELEQYNKRYDSYQRSYSNYMGMIFNLCGTTLQMILNNVWGKGYRILNSNEQGIYAVLKLERGDYRLHDKALFCAQHVNWGNLTPEEAENHRKLIRELEWKRSRLGTGYADLYKLAPDAEGIYEAAYRKSKENGKHIH